MKSLICDITGVSNISYEKIFGFWTGFRGGTYESLKVDLELPSAWKPYKKCIGGTLRLSDAQ